MLVRSGIGVGVPCGYSQFLAPPDGSQVVYYASRHTKKDNGFVWCDRTSTATPILITNGSPLYNCNYSDSGTSINCSIPISNDTPIITPSSYSLVDPESQEEWFRISLSSPDTGVAARAAEIRDLRYDASVESTPLATASAFRYYASAPLSQPNFASSKTGNLAIAKSSFRLRYLSATGYIKAWVSRRVTGVVHGATSQQYGAIVVTPDAYVFENEFGYPGPGVLYSPEQIVPTPEAFEIVFWSLLKWSAVPGYEPDISDTNNIQRNGFPDPAWEPAAP